MTERRRDAIAVVSLVALKAAAMLYALRCGFQQISDDDYARTVIAQMFVHEPKLDPSGTSWLPLPFWLYGALMMVFGRSLATARALAFVLGILSPTIVYAGLRAMRVDARGAWIGAGLGALTPWSVWLGLAPVPEGWAACCAAASLLLIAANRTVAAGSLVLVGALSRYEAWPIAAVVLVVCILRGARGERLAWAGAALAALGPLLWLANNAHAHGNALHFLSRVSTYHEAHVGPTALGQRLLEYPVELVRAAPEVLIAAAVGVRFLPRERWSLPFLGAAALLLFLVVANIRGGAPTHHAARALMTVIVLLGAVGGVGLAAVRTSVVATLGVAWAVFLGVRMRDVPGNTEAERRDAQVLHGKALAAQAISLDVTPCAYEHFALIAAFGAPENVHIRAALPTSGDCPNVTTSPAP